jgi:peptidase E
VHRQFADKTALPDRPAVAAAAAQIGRYVQQANAIFIAGGHVAVLLNRLRLLGIEKFLIDKPVLAWSAGAMALTDTVVLFHDSPPQGRANAEVFDQGLGLVRRMVVLPHAAARLHLDDPARVRLLARRFAPSRCVTLDDSAVLQFDRGHFLGGTGSKRLRRDGTLLEIAR